GGEGISLQNKLNDNESGTKNFFYFLPQLSFEKEIKQGRNFRMYYQSDVNAPTAGQLLPVTNYVDPLNLFAGNRDLKPEYRHNLYLNYILFDQFSFTSLFTHLNLG